MGEKPPGIKNEVLEMESRAAINELGGIGQ